MAMTRNHILLAASLSISTTWIGSIGYVKPTNAVELVGRAVLPAATFAPGPTSGQLITGANGQTPPFVSKQPVQGFSAILLGPLPGTFLAMPDNGFGGKANSPDALLRVYGIFPEFKTRFGGQGRVFAASPITGQVLGRTFGKRSFIQLNDKNSKLGFPIIAEQSTYPTTTIPVDPQLQTGRWLTGGDLDIESIRKGKDGTLWIGDEFGPFLVHTSASGEILEPPISLPNFKGLGSNTLVQSPDNPLLGSNTPNLARSKGFEGMALNTSRTKLYVMLEGPLTDDVDRSRLLINEFDLKTRKYTGRVFSYRMENTTESGQAIGDLTAINDSEFLVIERDSLQGDPQNPAFANPAKFKRLYKINLKKVDAQGFVKKELLVDLLNISDPHSVGDNGTTGGIFTFPFVTIEDVLPLDPFRVLIVNDNNFPFSVGRTPGVADNTELIVVKLDNPLSLVPAPPTSWQNYWRKHLR
ncbi:MAG TPA: esterase-like activity of phytase family protein [Stenomitos sp.]